MYTVIKRIEISAAHSLSLSYASKCERLHGHNWIITIHCRAAELNADGMVIDTKVKVCVKFHAADVPDTTRLFNIRNRLYACERIEVTVDSKGKQPMMTGYFFPASL